jgi:branched-chain amino acid transport system ATP-binding protein
VSTDSGANGNGPVLELKGLCKSFGGLQAVRDVTLTIMPGDRKAIIGPNGAGKTTLFNVITGIYSASAGHIVLFGQDVTSWPSHRRTALGMARTFQVTSLFPKLTVLDNVLLAIKGLRRSKFVMWRFLSSYKEVYDKAYHLLEQVGFLDVVFDVASQISVLHFGEVLETGTPQQIHASAKVQEIYLGTD